MSIDSKISNPYAKDLSQKYSDKRTEIPVSEIEHLLGLVEKKSLEEMEELLEQGNSSDENPEESSEELSEDTAPAGKWSKKRFNRLQENTKDEKESEEALSFPSIQTSGNKETSFHKFLICFVIIWEPKVDPVLEGLSILQGEPVVSEEDEKKPIPISVLALEKEQQSMIKFVDLYVDWASQGTDEDVQEEAIYGESPVTCILGTQQSRYTSCLVATRDDVSRKQRICFEQSSRKYPSSLV